MLNFSTMLNMTKITLNFLHRLLVSRDIIYLSDFLLGKPQQASKSYALLTTLLYVDERSLYG